MGNSKTPRELHDMVEMLEVQLKLLREYAINVFDNGKDYYLGEVANKLRLLCWRGRANEPLLFRILEEFGLSISWVIDGPPMDPPPNWQYPWNGDVTTLEQWLNTPHQYIRGASWTPIETIKAVCEKLGGAHADWELDDKLAALKDFSIDDRLPLFAGLKPLQFGIGEAAATVLRHGDSVLVEVKRLLNQRAQ